MNEWVYKFVHILTNSCRSAHLCLDHVDSLRAQLSDAVEDVHHTFTLCHVQHNVLLRWNSLFFQHQHCRQYRRTGLRETSDLMLTFDQLHFCCKTATEVTLIMLQNYISDMVLLSCQISILEGFLKDHVMLGAENIQYTVYYNRKRFCRYNNSQCYLKY